jgi:hypothetical protein
VLVAALVVTALAACGGAGDNAATGTPGRARLLAAVTQTVDARTARMALSFGMEGVPGADAFSMSGEGVFDFATQSGAMTLDATGFRVEERIVDGVAYVRMPGMPGGGGDKWIRMDLESLGSDPSALSQSQTDPTQILSYLAGVADDVVDVGPAEVRGVEVTHYRATLDLGRALDAPDVPAATRERLQKLAPSLRDIDMPVEVWIDADGRMRRMSMEMDLAEMLGGTDAGSGVPTGAAMHIEMELYDFGVPVDVEAPAPDEVATG